MKQKIIITIAILFISIGAIAQVTTQGNDFWLAFGRPYLSANNLQIRIVAGDQAVTGTITFIESGQVRNFNISANGVYTYNIPDVEKPWVLNNATTTSKSYRSIHIQSDNPIGAFALNQSSASADAACLIPTISLGTEYYQMGYIPTDTGWSDAFAVIATEDNTEVFFDGSLLATLDKGEMYYYRGIPSTGATAPNEDLTGKRIMSTKPVAVFSTTEFVRIPVSGSDQDNLFEQLLPTTLWGKEYFVPVMVRQTQTLNRIRVVASQDGTIVTQTGGTLITGTLTLNKGQWCELQTSLANNGCYIVADRPIEVGNYKSGGQPAFAIVSAINQQLTKSVMAPFVPIGATNLDSHAAQIMTPTATKNDTRVTIGIGAEQALSGGEWYDHSSGYSFYNMPLTNTTVSYQFGNSAGLNVLGYGTGSVESYYYLCGAGLRNLDLAYYVNDIHYQDPTLFCPNIYYPIRAEINFDLQTTVPGFIKWFIDGTEYALGRDRLEFPYRFTLGIHTIRLQATSKEGVVKIIDATKTFAYPTPSFIVQPVSPVCKDEPVTYTTQSGKLNYIWSLPGVIGTDYVITSGGVSSTSNTVTVAWKTTTSKTVTVNYSESGCMATNPATNTVSVIPCAGTLSASCMEICQGKGSVSYTLSGYVGTISKWQYAVAPYTTWIDINETAPTLIMENLPETMRVRALVNTACYSDPVSVTVIPTPVVSFTGPTAICAGSTSQLSPTSGGTWVSNNTAVATVTNAGVVTGVGTGSVTFTYTRDGGCSASITP